MMGFFGGMHPLCEYQLMQCMYLCMYVYTCLCCTGSGRAPSTGVHDVCVLSCICCLCCVPLIPKSPRLQGNSWSRGSSGLSARGSRCSSPFHCSPYGPAAPGPLGPVSAAPPRPAPCHQAPLASCLTPAPEPAVTPPSPLPSLPLWYPSLLFFWLSGSCLDVNPDLSSSFRCLLLTTHNTPSPFSFFLCHLIDGFFLLCPHLSPISPGCVLLCSVLKLIHGFMPPITCMNYLLFLPARKVFGETVKLQPISRHRHSSYMKLMEHRSASGPALLAAPRAEAPCLFKEWFKVSGLYTDLAARNYASLNQLSLPLGDY